MSNINIQVERDSVCMGDDFNAPHFIKFSLPVNGTLNDVFIHLKKENYLASVAGEDHSWKAIIKDEPLALILGNNKYPEKTEILNTELSKYVENGTLNVRFEYNSSTT